MVKDFEVKARVITIRGKAKVARGAEEAIILAPAYSKVRE